MDKVDIFDGVKSIDFDTAVKEGKIEYITQDAIECYLDEVQKCSVADKDLDLSDLKVIYTPIHGSGNKPVRAILKRIGIENVTVVKEQEKPDGNFPTAPYPNPEIRQPFEIALKMAEEICPDILLATDPDCDRVGIAVNHKGEFKLLTGNDVGILLLDYICKQRTKNGTMPKKPIAVKTIVTSEMCRGICKDFGVELIDVLTGFKFIGEQIGLLEKKGEEDRYIFGFEESYGYLAGSYVRDKDAVIGSMLICEMTAYYKNKGMTLVDALNALFEKYGYYICAQSSFAFEGISGMEKMQNIMNELRTNSPKELCGVKITEICDYELSVKKDLVNSKESVITLPKSNVLGFTLENGCGFIVRPSGTEPKIKIYFSSVADTFEASNANIDEMKQGCTVWFK
jgi:phosphoglucomutase